MPGAAATAEAPAPDRAPALQEPRAKTSDATEPAPAASAAPDATPGSNAVPVPNAVPAPVLVSAHRPWSQPGALAEIAAELALGPGDLVALFVSPLADTYRIARQAEQAFPGLTIVGCSTSGEINGQGYSSREILAVGFRRALFACDTILIPDLSQIDNHSLTHQILTARAGLEQAAPDWNTEFAFVLVDGLSLAEDMLMGALAMSLGPVPIFGGSAGDDFEFHQAFVIHGGQALRHGAVVTLVRSACPARLFKLDHLRPTDIRMVVTGADPVTRRVHEINGEPAGREYARILGKDPNQLSPLTFAAHPLLVRIGDQHHVRAIQRVDEAGHLVFFSAIDEGLVLTLAEADQIDHHLERELAALSQPTPPASILGFDCILRRAEAEQTQRIGALSDVLAKYRVLGFSTFGEQFNATHVNQTLTGVALYPPESGP